ncbi:M28 family peptidase [Pseudalkalibacillus caeni]|uniref:M28 family peptidase n=1 Tax=Exobacillus caeni TaxID=2574798 RepID=A0A5R9F6H4_9BACL|nr:M28 family peptidase [Pseudalkalibacillus caeni]TLS38621.1 M28 family peptidase [Pseudalkalibacillus caeni]
MKRSKSRHLLLSSVFSLSLLTPLALPANAETNTESINGFSKDKSHWQHEFEQNYLDSVKSTSIKKYSEAMSSRPSKVATEGNDASLNYAVQQLQEAGLKPRVKSYDVYMSKPKSISVSQTAPQQRKLSVIENIPEGTPYANEIVQGYNAYSPAGEVEAEIVYANYGRPEDFEELERRGISVKDKIVIARYGANFRGVKPSQAEQRGAAGVLLYSDPEDYVHGPVYPEGPWLPEDGIQRGSILYIFNYPGDPLTPGTASKKGTKRIDPADADSLPTVPTTPISYGEAEPLLAAMEGESAPESWQGGLPIDYKIGPGPTKVKLSLDIEYKNQPVNDVIVEIKGKKFPKEKIVIGAHRDTWVYGSNDNTSGWSTAMEIARSLGEMYQKGWRPDRTIVIAGWDGEEYGLLGSTEWVEEERKDLTKNAVAYLNMDGLGGKYFGASSVPSLDELIYSVTKEVEEPRTGTSVYDDWFARSGNKEPRLGQLGSGSDYTAFLQHIGVPSLGMGFGSPGGLYHSFYDNLDALQRFDDPDYQHHAAGAQLVGLAALRLANADVLPFQYSAYAREVVQLLENLEQNEGVDLSTVKAQAREWQFAASALEIKAADMIDDGIQGPETHKLKNINAAMLAQERDLINDKGLPERPWYKHQVWAPGMTTGYAALPLPALAEAIEAGDSKALEQASDALESALKDATNTVKSAIKK